MKQNSTRPIQRGLAPRLLALAMIGAAGCSGCGTSVAQPGGDVTTSPELKAIMDSDKSPKEKDALIRDLLLGRKPDAAGAKSQAKVKKKRSPGKS